MDLTILHDNMLLLITLATALIFALFSIMLWYHALRYTLNRRKTMIFLVTQTVVGTLLLVLSAILAIQL